MSFRNDAILHFYMHTEMPESVPITANLDCLIAVLGRTQVVVGSTQVVLSLCCKTHCCILDRVLSLYP